MKILQHQKAFRKAPVAHIHLIDYSDCVEVLDNFAQIGTVHC